MQLLLECLGEARCRGCRGQGALSLGLSRPGGGGGGPSVAPPGFLRFGFCGGGRVWICCAWLVSLGSLGSNCSQFGLLNSESRARCSGTSGSGQGFRQTLVWMGPGGRAPVPVVQKNEKKDKRLRADRSRQKHLNRWQEDQIPPASRFCRVQPHQDLEGRLSTPSCSVLPSGSGHGGLSCPSCK